MNRDNDLEGKYEFCWSCLVSGMAMCMPKIDYETMDHELLVKSLLLSTILRVLCPLIWTLLNEWGFL